MTYQRNETPEPLASDTPAVSKKPFHPQADYVLDLLVAAGHITREKAFQARDIAVEFGPDAATPAPGAPAGFKLVPIEATEAMKAAAVVYANGNAVYKNVKAEVLRIEESIYGEVFEAMLSAAPGAPGQEAGVADAKDAARYRWLRDRSQYTYNQAWIGSITAKVTPCDFFSRDEALQALDAAIDAALPPSGAGEKREWLKCDACGKDMRGHDRMGHCAAGGNGGEG